MQILICGHQNYEWGKPGVSSLIHRIQSSNPAFLPLLDPQAKYAELWIGTHTNLPSFLLTTPFLTLKDYLRQNPELLGENLDKTQKKEAELPFLMKVLSVGKSLSIQAHPDKDLAQVLNETSPHIYKDVNHKPEMAIALTKFEAFCNFASFENIEQNLKHYPEFEVVFQKEILENFRKKRNEDGLKGLVFDLFQTKESILKENSYKHWKERQI